MAHVNLPMYPGKNENLGEPTGAVARKFARMAPKSDGMTVPRAGSASMPDAHGQRHTPATVSAKSSHSFNIPGKYADRWWSYNNGRKESRF